MISKDNFLVDNCETAGTDIFGKKHIQLSTSI